jgi:hypothetical protein
MAATRPSGLGAGGWSGLAAVGRALLPSVVALERPATETATIWRRGTAAARKRAEGSGEKKGQQRRKSGPEPQWMIFRESFESTFPAVASVVQSLSHTPAAPATSAAPPTSWGNCGDLGFGFWVCEPRRWGGDLGGWSCEHTQVDMGVTDRGGQRRPPHEAPCHCCLPWWCSRALLWREQKPCKAGGRLAAAAAANHRGGPAAGHEARAGPAPTTTAAAATAAGGGRDGGGEGEGDSCGRRREAQQDEE